MRHSVVLEYARCMGCTTCIKNCPTEAIRVRSGKATILNERCIDCGKCIQVCPHNAIHSLSDPLDRLKDYAYNIALPEPALYGQFQNLYDVNIILGGLLKIGFDRVYEVARAAELLSLHARLHADETGGLPAPRISSACPTVLRLIRVRFPKLIPQVSPTVAPMELAAILARREAAAATGLPPEQIGVFSIVPCSAKVTAAYAPDRLQKPVLDGAFSIRDIYLKLLSPMKEVTDPAPLSSAGAAGVGWACCGGESAAGPDARHVAVDGIENVIRMLEELEDGRLPEVDFIELATCVQGCVGGCFTVENPYVAQMRIKNLMKELPPARSGDWESEQAAGSAHTDRPLEYDPVFVLDEDRGAAMEKLKRIEDLTSRLPGLNCGSCGAPSCHAFAEDVVLGRADQTDCIFKVRERMQHMADGGSADADEYLPAPFRRRTSPAEHK